MKSLHSGIDPCHSWHTMRFSDAPTPESMAKIIGETEDEQRLEGFFNEAHNEWVELHTLPSFSKKYELLELFSVFRSAITYAKGDPAVARSLLKTQNVWAFLMGKINQLPFETALRVATIDHALMVNPSTPVSVLNILLRRYSTAVSLNPLHLIISESNGWSSEENRKIILENIGEMSLPLAAFTQATPPQRMDILLDFMEFFLQIETRPEISFFKNSEYDSSKELLAKIVEEEVEMMKVVRFGRMNSAKETIGSSLMPFLRKAGDFQGSQSRSTGRRVVRSFFEKLQPYRSSFNQPRVEEFIWGLLLEPIEGFYDEENVLRNEYGRLCFQVFLADRIQARGIFEGPKFHPTAFDAEQSLLQVWHDALVHFEPTPKQRSRR